MAGENKVNLESQLSLEKLISELQQSRDEADKLKKELIDANKQIKSGFDSTSNSAKNMGQELQNAIGRIEAQKNLIGKLNQELDNLKKNQSAFDTTQIKAYQDQIQKLQTELTNLKNGSAAATTAVTGTATATSNMAMLIGKAKTAIDSFVLSFGPMFIATQAVSILKGAVSDLWEKMTGHSTEQKAMNELMDSAKGVYVSTASKVAELKEMVALAKDGLVDKETVVKEYNDSMGKVVGTVTDLNGVEQSLIENSDNFIEAMTKREAGMNAYKRVADLVFQKQDALMKLEKDGKASFLGVDLGKQITKEIDEQIDAYTKLGDTLTRQSAALLKPFNDRVKFQKEDSEARKAIQDAEHLQDERNFKLQQDREKETEKSRRQSEAARRKAEAERLKALREEEARLQRILQLEKQLAGLELDLLDAGRTKDIASEGARYGTAVAALENMKKKSKTSAEEIKLIDQLLEKQKELHSKKLLDIDKKYAEEALKTFQSAQESINAVLLKDEDKEQYELTAKYDRLLKAIREARKKAVEGVKDDKTLRLLNFTFDEQEISLQDQKGKESVQLTQKWNLKKLDEQEKLALALNDVLQKQGVNEKQLETLKEIGKLNVTIEYAKKKLEILRAAGGEENRLQILQLEKVIQDAEKGLKKLAKNTDILDVLFGKDALNQETKRFISEAIGNLFTGTISLIDEQIKARQRLIDKIDEQIGKQQQAVDKEKELAEKGLANNLSIENQRLTALQKQKEKELEQEKKLTKEKQALQRAQLVADSLAQGSNLVTASTEIFKVLAKLGPIGVGIAIASIGAMVAGFIASKAAAFKAVGNVPKFRKGGGLLLDGSSHEEGGIQLVDTKTGTVKGEAEGNEYGYFFRQGKKVKQKFEPLLDAINKDELSQWTFDDLRRFIQPSGIDFSGKKAAAIQTPASGAGAAKSDASASPTTTLLAEVARNTAELVKLKKEEERITDLQDRTIYKKGNYTRIVHKKKGGENEDGDV